MASHDFAFGNSTASQLPPTSPSHGRHQTQLSTVQELLNAIDPPGTPKKRRGLWTVATHVAECASVPLSHMPIETLRSIGPDLSLWLRERRYSPKSISTFMYNLRLLIQCADDYGCSDATRLLRIQWEPIESAIRVVSRAPKNIVQFAINRGKGPRAFTDADLDAWGAWMERRGRQHRWVRQLKSMFRQILRKRQLTHLVPSLNCQPAPSEYGIPVKDMPEPLKDEVVELLAWKQARFAKGRPQWTRHREVSARLLRSVISRLFGFSTKVAGHTNINSFATLFTEEIVTEFMEWALNDRNLSRSSLLRLSMIYGALRHHPKHKNRDYSWFTTVFDQVPHDDPVGKMERKAKKFVPYEVLRQIPNKIRAKRTKGRLSQVQVARLVHDELLIAWLTTLPWRQRNIRECRLGDSRTANVFYDTLPELEHVAKSKWVEEALTKNPTQKFWQFVFREEENKTGHRVRGIIPRHLVPLLEEYLNCHRATLVCGADPGTLFLNRDGGVLDRQVTTDGVAELVLEHTGRRMTPHLFRDSFALAYLEAFPEDYLTLSKILWHRSVQYTLSVYGKNYDESNGAKRIDEWLN